MALREITKVLFLTAAVTQQTAASSAETGLKILSALSKRVGVFIFVLLHNIPAGGVTSSCVSRASPSHSDVGRTVCHGLSRSLMTERFLYLKAKHLLGLDLLSAAPHNL